MKRLVLFLIILVAATGVFAQHIPAYSADDIIHRTSSKDTLYIINFWATWCAPCVQELPEFNKLQKKYEGRPVKVLLVSLDFKTDYPNKLAVFLQRKNIMPEVVWLSDTNPNDFIPKIENSWEGSIPATVIVHPGKGFKKFIEGQVSEREIATIADRLID